MAVPRRHREYDTSSPNTEEYDVYVTKPVWTNCSDGEGNYHWPPHYDKDELVEFTNTKVIHYYKDKSDTHEFYRVHNGPWERVAVKPAKREARVGRNKPCPCGSNNKYKRCCGK